MKKNIFAAALLASLVSPVMAGDFYLAGDVGWAKFDLDDDGSSYGKSDTSFSLSGGYQFSSNFGVELAYRQLLNGVKLSFEDDFSSKISVKALQVSLIGSLPINDSTSVYGRLGYAHLSSKASWYDSDLVKLGSDSGSDNKAFAGVGARYSVTDTVGLRVEYDRYAKWDGAVLSALTVGVDYRF